MRDRWDNTVRGAVNLLKVCVSLVCFLLFFQSLWEYGAAASYIGPDLWFCVSLFVPRRNITSWGIVIVDDSR